MNKGLKSIIGTVLFIVLLILAAYAYRTLSADYLANHDLPAEGSGGEVKYPAPDFAVYDAEGQEIKLSDFRGQPVVLNFWASWCPTCRANMPAFEKVYNEFKEEAAFLMIDLVDGGRETQESGQSYIEKEGYSFPVYFDLKQEAAINYGIYSIPTTLIIDAEGYIVTGYQGIRTESMLRQDIGSLIQE